MNKKYKILKEKEYTVALASNLIFGVTWSFVLHLAEILDVFLVLSKIYSKPHKKLRFIQSKPPSLKCLKLRTGFGASAKRPEKGYQELKKIVICLVFDIA